MDGEIILPAPAPDGANAVRVVAAPRPLGTARIALAVAAGFSLADIFAQVQPDPRLRRQAHIWVGDGAGPPEEVPPEYWARVRPKPGATVTIRVAPGGGGGGKNPLRTILTLAVLAASFVLPGAILTAPGAVVFAGVTAGQLVGAGIGILGSLLVNAIAPPPKPKLGSLSGDARDSPTLFITGARNQARPFGTVPRVMGRHRMVPPLGALTFSETVGDDQYFRILIVWGYGPLQIETLRLAETPIAAYSDVEIETRAGYPDDPPLTLWPNDVYEEQVSVQLTQAGGWATRTSQPEADELGVDVTWPQGLVEFGSNNRKLPRSVSVQVQYRAVGAPDWTAAGTIALTEKRTNALRKGLRWKVARGQYEVRLRRTTNDTDDETIFDRSYWTALRTITDEDPIAFPHPLAKTAIRIKASDQLSGSVDEINGVVTSILPDWDSGSASWVERATSNPASIYRHVLQGNANARPLADARVDLAGLQAWHAQCAAAGREFNMVLDFPSTVLETLHSVAAAGRARPARRDGGTWGVVVDAPQSVPVQHFTPRNSWGFQGRIAYPDLPHGWRVRFVNRNIDWRQDERIVYDDGYGPANATKFEGLELAGITDPDQVWKDGRYHIATARLRPHGYSLFADVEHLVCERGALVRVTHDLMLLGLASGRIKDVERDGGDNVVAVTVDEACAMEGAKQYGLSIRTVGNAALVARVVTAPGAQTRLALSPAIPAAQAPAVDSGGDGLVGCLFGFGERGAETGDFLVSDIRRGPNLSAQLMLVDAAPAVHNADTGTIPAFVSGITVPPGLIKPAVAELRSDESVLYRDIDGALTSRILVQLLRPGAISARVTGIETAFRPQGSQASWTYLPPAPADALEISIFDVEDGETYEVRLRYATTGQPGPWTASALHTVIGKSTPPPDPTALSLEGDWLRWSQDRPPDFKGFEVRSVPGTIADWSLGTPAHVGVLETAELDISNQPRGARVYMVKALDVAGNYSAGFARLVRDLGDRPVANVVLSRDLAGAGFPGTITGGSVEMGVLGAGDTAAYLPNGMAPYLPAGDEPYLPSSFTGLSYESATIVPAGDEVPSRVLVQMAASGYWRLDYQRGMDDPYLPEAGDPYLPAADDPYLPSSFDGVWRAWPDYIDMIAGEAIKFRFTGAGADAQARLSAFTVVFDVPDESEFVAALALDSGGTRVPLSRSYREIVVVNATLHGGGSAVRVEIADKDADLGPLLQARDGGGSGAAAVVDVHIQGIKG